MHSMIDLQKKGLRKVGGRIKEWNTNRKEEKKRIHAQEEKYKKQLEGRYIRQRVEYKLKAKYAKPGGFGSLWQLPKPGQRSAGQSILEGLSGNANTRKKKR
jgi:hypothetical protein